MQRILRRALTSATFGLVLASCGSLRAAVPAGACDTGDPDCLAGIGTGTGTATGGTGPGGTGTGGTGTGGPTGEDCTDGVDNDGDGDEDCADPECASVCDQDSDGHVDEALGGDDCDDGDPDTYPGAPELCDSLDNNCSGQNDEDTDGDGFHACQDCDNANAAVNPNAVEICDGLDNDCAGGVDNDSDGDGSDACADCNDADGTIYPGAVELCGEGIDSDCDGQDCTGYVEDFEAGAVTAPFVSGGNALWFVQSGTKHLGTYGYECGNIADNQNSSTQLVVNYTSAGSVSFWHTGSTESNYDFLKFTIDGVEQLSRSGSWGWTPALYNVSAGAHTFVWKYTKDGSVSTGSDTVWIDDVNFINGAP